MSENTNAVICYIPVLGVLAAIYFLLFNKDRVVKWYAMQSALLWTAVIIANIILQISYVGAVLIPLFNIVGLIVGPLVIAIKISQKEIVRLPFLADLADRCLEKIK